MIERYSRPEMARIWSQEAKYNAWLKVELAVCEVYAKRGVIPAHAACTLRAVGLRYLIKHFAIIRQRLKALGATLGGRGAPELRRSWMMTRCPAAARFSASGRNSSISWRPP